MCNSNAPELCIGVVNTNCVKFHSTMSSIH